MVLAWGEFLPLGTGEWPLAGSQAWPGARNLAEPLLLLLPSKGCLHVAAGECLGTKQLVHMANLEQ